MGSIHAFFVFPTYLSAPHPSPCGQRWCYHSFTNSQNLTNSAKENCFFFFFHSFLLQSVTLYCERSISNDRTGLAYAENGQLFGTLEFPKNESLKPDDAAGRLLIRNVKSAWVKTAGSISQKVYEVLVQKVDNESVTLKLSSQMCLDLQLTDSGQISVDVQFQLNRQPLCEWHTAIDRLGPIQLRLLFPKPNEPPVKLVNQGVNIIFIQ